MRRTPWRPCGCGAQPRRWPPAGTFRSPAAPSIAPVWTWRCRAVPCRSAATAPQVAGEVEKRRVGTTATGCTCTLARWSWCWPGRREPIRRGARLGRDSCLPFILKTRRESPVPTARRRYAMAGERGWRGGADTSGVSPPVIGCAGPPSLWAPAQCCRRTRQRRGRRVQTPQALTAFAGQPRLSAPWQKPGCCCGATLDALIRAETHPGIDRPMSGTAHDGVSSRILRFVYTRCFNGIGGIK
jgi:hypothetical protein